jgi:mono/diheme cytochrome c family protein
MPRLLPLAIVLLCSGAGGASAAERLTYEQQVRPLLRTHCFHCHGEAGEKQAEPGLRLRRWIVAGGESGPAVVPGQPADSLLLQRVASGEMPPGEDQHLPADDVALIRRWIA